MTDKGDDPYEKGSIDVPNEGHYASDIPDDHKCGELIPDPDRCTKINCLIRLHYPTVKVSIQYFSDTER